MESLLIFVAAANVLATLIKAIRVTIDLRGEKLGRVDHSKNSLWMIAPMPMRLDVLRSAQQGLAWHSPIIQSWASFLSHRLLSCRDTAQGTSCMCGQRASFNAASVAHEAIGSVDAYIQRRGVDPWLIVVGARSKDRSERRVEVLAVRHQPRHFASEFVNFAVRRAQLLTKRQRYANFSVWRRDQPGQLSIDFVQRTRDGDDADNI